jgi:hypothetical protein
MFPDFVTSAIQAVALACASLFNGYRRRRAQTDRDKDLRAQLGRIEHILDTRLPK